MPKDYIPVALKRLAYERGNGCCEYCRSQVKFAIDPFVIEHIVPISWRGTSTRLLNMRTKGTHCINLRFSSTI